MNEYKGKALLGAPTAVAAINIEGNTLHSLCQLPPAWIVKKDIQKAPRRIEIKEAKLLIIDEISMVTANLLDGVSGFFRVNRSIDLPFGGITLIMVGDLFQLPPVVNQSTKKLFERIYGSAKFFHAKSLNLSKYYAIELKKTFRQTDQSFISLLTNIREGNELNHSLEILNKKCEITDTPSEGAVWLSPRNSEVDNRNILKLNEIESEKKIYYGLLQGKFKSDRLPSPINLVLKVQAQVMFTKNHPDKKWINGSIGTIESMTEKSILVRLSTINETVNVKPVTWFDYQYQWNSYTREIERNEIGSYTQFPLVLAWAITIHKSQGRTIDKVHLDLGRGAFETGQTYVALSRCRTIEGLSLSRPGQTRTVDLPIMSLT